MDKNAPWLYLQDKHSCKGVILRPCQGKEAAAVIKIPDKGRVPVSQ